MSRVLVTGGYREGDVAVTPSWSEWVMGPTCFTNCLSPHTPITLAEMDALVKYGGWQVYREEPEPPFVRQTVYCDPSMQLPYRVEGLPKEWMGKPVLIVPDTPENRALLERKPGKCEKCDGSGKVYFTYGRPGSPEFDVLPSDEELEAAMRLTDAGRESLKGDKTDE